MSELRIGRPPAAPVSQPQRHSPGTGLVITAAVMLVLVAVAVAAYVLGRANEPAAQASPSPSTVQLDEASACFVLVPLLDEAQKHVMAIVEHPDGSTVTAKQVEATQVGLEALQPGVPPEMRQEIAPIVDLMRQLKYVLMGYGNKTLDTEASRSAAIRLLAMCSNYAD